MVDKLRTASRFTGGLQRFLASRLSQSNCHNLVTEQLDGRQDSFLQLMQEGVFNNPASPYLPLLRKVGVSFADLASAVRREGIEATLGMLFDQGVWVTLDEFKGRVPLERTGLHLNTTDRHFDNPLISRHFSLRTGGSRSRGTLLYIEFDLVEYEAAQDRLFLDAFDLIHRPMAIWRPVPPGSAGIKGVLRRAKLGLRLDHWFSQNSLSAAPSQFGYLGVTCLSVLSAKARGLRIPLPEHVPLPAAAKVARWLAVMTAEGTPALVDTIVSSGVRICLAARDQGLDIRGTFFRCGGEPLTPAKSQVIEDAGGRVVCHYAMAELGRIGIACATAEHIDEVHILGDKVGVIQRAKTVGEASVPALFLTSIHASSPKLALNVESGDYGVLTERDCGCPMSQIGYHQHAHTIRSYEKLTTEGMHFLGHELVVLIEEVLPAQFGGAPTDYQMVEAEEQGMTKIRLIVSPRVGPMDETTVVSCVLETLGGTSPGMKMMADYWRQGETLQVIREEPHLTAAAKIQALHAPTRAEGDSR